jgi:cytochrome c2
MTVVFSAANRKKGVEVTGRVRHMRITLKAMIAMVGCLVLPGVVEAQGNAAEGENVFKKCKVCHDAGDGAKNKIGPILNDIVGRKAASIEGYPYSGDLKALGSQGFVWTEENLNKYLAKVKDVVADGKMVFPGLKDDQDRKDLIAYLKKFGK